jgi:hypothetical protein
MRTLSNVAAATASTSMRPSRLMSPVASGRPVAPDSIGEPNVPSPRPSRIRRRENLSRVTTSVIPSRLKSAGQSSPMVSLSV